MTAVPTVAPTVWPKALARRLLGPIMYVAAFAWCYERFLASEFGHLVGMDLYSRPFDFTVFSTAVAILPALVYRGMRAVSSALAVIIYLLLYVPIIVTFALGSNRPLSEIAGVELTFMVGMVVLFLADAVVVDDPISFIRRVDLNPLVLWLTVASTVYLVVLYRGNLRFSSFGEDLYVQRFENDVIGSGIIARYVSTWLYTLLAPVALSYGLVARRYVYVAAGLGAWLVLYMATANKVMILLAPASLGLYFLLRGDITKVFGRLSVSLTALIGTAVLVGGVNPVLQVAASILVYRTVGNGGWATKLYYDFFAFYPRTEYSHIALINRLVHYPYGDRLLGQAVGQFYIAADMNANANFWATDGIAAMGLTGVAIASVACAICFALINVATQRHNRLQVVIAFLPFLATLLNQSLASSMWSGGGAFLILYFLLQQATQTSMTAKTRIASGARQTA